MDIYMQIRKILGEELRELLAFGTKLLRVAPRIRFRSEVFEEDVVGVCQVGGAGVFKGFPRVGTGVVDLYLEVLAAAGVDAVEEFAHAEVADVLGGEVAGQGTFFVVRHFGEHAHEREFVEQVVD